MTHLCINTNREHQERPLKGLNWTQQGSHICVRGVGGPPPCMQECFTRFHSAKALGAHMCGPCATAACMAAGLGSEEVLHV